ncbi:MAG: fibronectin type III domain-containing protein, partial [Thermoleophilia bacterium]|nr:fibronectin type III domain-containing protein [Thermoleophilia bacterium]
ADGIVATEAQSSEATVGGLAPATRHVFEVAAVGLHEGPRSAPLEVLTAPAAPAGLRATGTTPTSVSLAWDPVAGAASYKVYVGGAFRTAAQSNSAEIQGLSPRTSYAFAVSAVGVEGAEGPLSEPLTVTTLAPVPTGLLSGKLSPIAYDKVTNPWAATDGNISTRCTLDNTGGYLLYDLGRSHYVAWIEVYYPKSDGIAKAYFLDGAMNVIRQVQLYGGWPQNAQ